MALTEAPVLDDKVRAGVQLKDWAPVAKMVVEEPSHIYVLGELIPTFGKGTTYTGKVKDPVHNPLFPTIVYVVVLAGVATTDGPVE